MLTRKAANAEVLKLQTQLAAIGQPTESRKGLRRELEAARKRNKEFETSIDALEAILKRTELELEQFKQRIVEIKKKLSEESRVEFEIFWEELSK